MRFLALFCKIVCVLGICSWLAAEPLPHQSSAEAGDSGNPNKHFERLRNHPNLVASWTLRQADDYVHGRGHRFSKNPHVKYSPDLNAAKVCLPPRENELAAHGGFMLEWGQLDWDAGDRLVVQHEFMISSAMHDHATKTGENGRGSAGFKFTNLCRGRQITYELRTGFAQETHSVIDFRAYTRKLEGRQERDEFASDVANPKRTFFGVGGGYDRHPGPDSEFIYGQKAPHPDCFKAINDRWVRVTYELERVGQGTRVKIWLADEDVPPKLVVASPVDPELGFLTANIEPITALYIELDTSQETSYDEDQPERWAAFRNVVVLRGVEGEDVLGGRPLRS